jgi:hypothetical protein
MLSQVLAGASIATTVFSSKLLSAESVEQAVASHPPSSASRHPSQSSPRVRFASGCVAGFGEALTARDKFCIFRLP